MSFANYKMAELWQSFMPVRKEISNGITNDLISLVLYQPTHFDDFKTTNEFERWAAVEVSNFDKCHPAWKHLFCQKGFMQFLNTREYIQTIQFSNTFFKPVCPALVTF